MSRNIPNSFQLPNAIIDDYLAEMPWHATKCYLFIVRKTRGWQKDSDYISLSQFMDGTGISRSSVYEALSWLEGKKLIARVKGKSVRNMAEYTLVNDPDEPSAPTDTNPATVRPHGLNRPPPRTEPSAPTEQQYPLNTKSTQVQNKPDARILPGNCQLPKECRCPKCKNAVNRLVVNCKKQGWEKQQIFDCPSRSTVTEHWAKWNTNHDVEKILLRLITAVGEGQYKPGGMKSYTTAIDSVLAELDYEQSEAMA